MDNPNYVEPSGISSYFVNKDDVNYQNYNKTPNIIGAPQKKYNRVQKENHVTNPIIVREGQIFDGRGDIFYTCKSGGTSCILGDGSQDEGQEKVFIMYNGSVLRNIVVKYRFADGINCWSRDLNNDADGRVIIENLTFDNAKFEDSINVQHGWRGDVLMRSIEWYGTGKYDKLTQVNGNEGGVLRYIDIIADIDSSYKLIEGNYDTKVYMRNVTTNGRVKFNRCVLLDLYTDEKTWNQIAWKMDCNRCDDYEADKCESDEEDCLDCQNQAVENRKGRTRQECEKDAVNRLINPYENFDISKFHPQVKKFYENYV